ncbi:hypothetical protein P8452_65861 [Trifolium repens]|nr:hypothetical protein P8452_65859 [Trifolium repens]WJX83182.1 hypothetical protein P8452_65860 [Trifolium repens]WJX83183.1 hypothetical protein P8452_65861 [Trifolium repens]
MVVDIPDAVTLWNDLHRLMLLIYSNKAMIQDKSISSRQFSDRDGRWRICLMPWQWWWRGGLCSVTVKFMKAAVSLTDQLVVVHEYD